MNFNRKTHKFGMAYHNAERDYIVWPDDDMRHFRKLEGGNIENWSCDRRWWLEDASCELVRAPEHDYVSRADVIKLVNRIKECQETLERVPVDLRVSMDVTREIICNAQALSDFKDKHG